LINSFILYKEMCSSLNKKVLKLFEFKLDVALALMFSGSGAEERYVGCWWVVDRSSII
jgi:hypothetical protein